ncbi:PhzF family phenazine biosynthesis protein [Celeribacter indicus]|uniref:Isomerase n=1 Tax=Celeribacter indicus TaxID=1208324 RepID=A0A0B5E0A5_9RHOB|nr:PhzF family phenazine biosynthesis protein [Celeribacter indicus]AJE46436.1 isomerase [Celeribacter indicus]SDW56657.1 trans-2,3-dihydro-3-hydroxyanthranilate isomerase [Celeribacter indicus]
MTRYLTYDVFTDRPFGGNPLAVIPEAQDLPEPRLQEIAREFNYSETVFLYPPEDPAHTARLRIFTPVAEVPFAGHPTIGAAVALAGLGHGPQMRLELKIGRIDAVAHDGRAHFVARQPLEILARPAPDLVAAALGLARADLAGPPVMAGMGLAFTFTELASRAALSRIATDLAAFRAGNALHPAGLDFAQAPYWRDGDTIHMRMFAPLDNVPEDPATGSAAAALGRLLAGTGDRAVFTVHQGDDMGRPSRISVTATPEAVTIGGAAVRVMEGRLVT